MITTVPAALSEAACGRRRDFRPAAQIFTRHHQALRQRLWRPESRSTFHAVHPQADLNAKLPPFAQPMRTNGLRNMHRPPPALAGSCPKRGRPTFAAWCRKLLLRAWQCKPRALIYFGGLRPKTRFCFGGCAPGPRGKRSACRCTGALKRVLPGATPIWRGPRLILRTNMSYTLRRKPPRTAGRTGAIVAPRSRATSRSLRSFARRRRVAVRAGCAPSFSHGCHSGDQMKVDAEAASTRRGACRDRHRPIRRLGGRLGAEL